MADTLDAQGALAEQNPNIISDIYTGSSASTPMTAPPAPTAPAGMEGMNNVAQDMASQLYGSGMVSGLETKRNAQIQELMDYDKMLGDIYSGGSYFPTVEGYVDNPADRIAGLAGISNQTSGLTSRVSSAVDTTERAYNMAISNVMDRFMDFMDMQQQQKQWEREMDLREKELGLSGNGILDTLSEEQAILQVLQTGGPQAQAIFSTVPPSQRGALAKTILSMGGMDVYRQSADLSSLMSETERKAYDKQSALMQDIDMARSVFEGEGGGGGTGWLAGLIPSWFPFQSEEARNLRSTASQFLSNRLVELSGSQITPFEAQRLKQFLPDVRKSEQQNLADLNRLRQNLLVNQEIFERSKRTGQTLAEAYQEYGPTAFANAGMTYPGSGGGVSTIAGEPKESLWSRISGGTEAQAQITTPPAPEPGMIRARERSTGDEGWLTPAEFDPNIYERI